MIHVCRKIEQDINPDGRSGGLGSGNLQVPHYDAPTGWQPRIIESNATGVTIIFDQEAPLVVEAQETEGIPPETMSGEEFTTPVLE